MEGSCEKCKFVGQGDIDKASLKRPLHCKRYPPQMCVVGQSMMSMFPPVQEAHICGEFVLKFELAH